MKKFLLLLIIVLAACNQTPPTNPGFDHKNAFGPAGVLPPGATQISAEEFLKLQKEPGFRFVNPTQQQQDKAAFQARNLEVESAISALVLKRPNLAKRLADPPLNNPNLKPSDDGNYLLSLKDNNNETQQVVTMGKSSTHAWVAEGVKKFPTFENQMKLYKALYAALPNRLKTTYASPESLNALPAVQLEARVLALAKALSAIGANAVTASLPATATRFGTTRALGNPPPGYVLDPTLEEGAGKGSDHADKAACATHKLLGVYANFDWTMKYFATSVKSQGLRGSCVAFGITSALESVVSMQLGRWVNLSEQDLYNHMKMTWDNQDYGDGAWAEDTFEQMTDNNYVMPFESAWNYNPSLSRLDDKAQEAYFNSCSGYLETCSDTTHQGRWICTIHNQDEYCAYVSQAVTGAFDMTSSAGAVFSLDTDLDSESLDLMLGLLSAGYPVVLGTRVTDSFANPDANGFVNYVPDQEELGGHEVHITGFITNDVLHQKLPNAPAGLGGGYFIVKNSWSICFGDAGYLYLPFQYVSDYGNDAFAIIPSVAGNHAPNLEISTPNDKTHVPYGALNMVHLGVTVSDLEDGNACCTVSWTSDKDGFLGFGKTLDITFSTAGSRVVTATAKDSGGVSRSDAITLIADNGAPTVKINSPTPNQQLTKGADYVLDGEGHDPNEPAFLLPCSSLTWTSNIDGFLGTGCNPSVNFSSTGTRTLKLSGKDSQGDTATATVNINVVNPPATGAPIITILNPINGQVFAPKEFVIPKYSFVDPGAPKFPIYSFQWKLKIGTLEIPITLKNNGFGGFGFTPSDYLTSNCGTSTGELWLYITDPEGLTGSSRVAIDVLYPQC